MNVCPQVAVPGTNGLGTLCPTRSASFEVGTGGGGTGGGSPPPSIVLRMVPLAPETQPWADRLAQTYARFGQWGKA